MNSVDENIWTMQSIAGAAPGFSNNAGATDSFSQPTGLLLGDQTRTLYIADTGNHSIRTLNLDTRTVYTAFNIQSFQGFLGDGGAAKDARFDQPTAVTACPNGDIFIADTIGSVALPQRPKLFPPCWAMAWRHLTTKVVAHPMRFRSINRVAWLAMPSGTCLYHRAKRCAC
jgi:hypothetical protein